MLSESWQKAVPRQSGEGVALPGEEGRGWKGWTPCEEI